MNPIRLTVDRVRELLATEKSRDVRLMLPQPPSETTAFRHPGDAFEFYPWISSGEREEPLGDKSFGCPYGRPFERLWVKEAWIRYQTLSHVRRRDGRSFCELSDGLAGYKADGFDTVEEFRLHTMLMGGFEGIHTDGETWLTAETMPRWASRMVVGLAYAEPARLRDISDKPGFVEHWGRYYQDNYWAWVLDLELVDKR